ncbi:MAG: dTMP kinase [Gemmatimonadales bacterium]|nr:MAG: dTMP kinase [Gemmatimonadales bacterium]
MPGRRGLFIVLEGVEGAGKTTQLARLGAWLESAGVPVRRGREPGGTALGEAVRGVLLDRAELDMAPESELLLMLAARAAFVREVVRPALEAGVVMLADRFESSTFAYQGYGRGLPLEEVRRLNTFATGGLRPDRVVILDLPAEEGRARQRREGKDADRIERGGEAFHERVARGYRELGASDPAAVLVDARGDEGTVHRRIVEAVAPLLPSSFPELRTGAGGLIVAGGQSAPHPPLPRDRQPDLQPDPSGSRAGSRAAAPDSSSDAT